MHHQLLPCSPSIRVDIVELPEPCAQAVANHSGPNAETHLIDNGPMEARCVLRGVGHGILHGPESTQKDARRGRTCAQAQPHKHRHSGAWRIPESPPAAGFHRSARRPTSTRSGACPIRRRGRPSSHPRGHERAGRTRAESPQRTASRAGAWQGSGSGRHASGRYEAAAPSLVLEPWRHRRNIPKCLFVLRSIACAGTLSCSLWVAAVECAEVSLCTTIGHHRFVFIRPWPSPGLFSGHD